MSDSLSTDRPSYDPKPSLKYASLVGLQAGAVGAFVSAIQNALASHSHGAMGFVTRTGTTIGFFGALMLLSYFESHFLGFSCHGCHIRLDGVRCSQPTTHRWCCKRRGWRMCSWVLSRTSGLVHPCWRPYSRSGLLLARSIPMAVGSCVVLGAAMGTFDYSGQLAGEKGRTWEEKRRQFFKQPVKPLIETTVAWIV